MSPEIVYQANDHAVLEDWRRAKELQLIFSALFEFNPRANTNSQSDPHASLLNEYHIQPPTADELRRLPPLNSHQAKVFKLDALRSLQLINAGRLAPTPAQIYEQSLG